MDVETITAAAAVAVALAVAYLYVFVSAGHKNKNAPPYVPYVLPVVGHAVQFGTDPLKFLHDQYAKYGEVFTIKVIGRDMTYLLSNEASAFFVNAKGEDVSAEEAYAAITVPVFGKDVVYDVPYPVLVEQKKMIKSGLNKEVFEVYVPLIQQEVEDYFRNWAATGQTDLLKTFSELTIMTASTCLMGAEIRKLLDVEVAKLYHDLDQGFTPINFMFPNVPFPANHRRDLAQQKLSNLFIGVVRERRAKGEDQEYNDMMDNLMKQEYRNGEKLRDHQIANLMIALLMAGQHTSSTTLSWFASYLAENPHWQKALLDEQKSVQGGDFAPLDYATIDNLPILDRCLKETLRLAPPLLSLMRKVVQPVEYKGYVIPKGHYICVSPTATHRLPDIWSNAGTFDPDRFLPPREEDVKGGKFCYFPFGAGRHRCIGEQFAYLQIKTIIATFLRLFAIKLTEKGFPQPDYTSMVVLPKEPVVTYTHRDLSLL